MDIPDWDSHSFQNHGTDVHFRVTRQTYILEPFPSPHSSPPGDFSDENIVVYDKKGNNDDDSDDESDDDDSNDDYDVWDDSRPPQLFSALSDSLLFMIQLNIMDQWMEERTNKWTNGWTHPLKEMPGGFRSFLYFRWPEIPDICDGSVILISFAYCGCEIFSLIVIL